MIEPDNQNSGSDSWQVWSKFVLIELQRLSQDQDKMNTILQQNTVSLQEHMSQTKAVKELASAALKRNDLLKEHIAAEKELLEQQLEPIKTHVKIVSTVFKWLLPSGVLMAIPACVYYILKLFGKI